MSRATRNIEFWSEKDLICDWSISVKSGGTIKDAVAIALKKRRKELEAKSLSTDILRWKIKEQNKYETDPNEKDNETKKGTPDVTPEGQGKNANNQADAEGD